MDAFARLLAPYLPYATEEVWSWMHEAKAPCTTPHGRRLKRTMRPQQPSSPELLTHAGEALAALRGIKSKAKVSMKTPILSVQLGVPMKRANPSKAHWAISPKPVAWSDASPSWERPPH